MYKSPVEDNINHINKKHSERTLHFVDKLIHLFDTKHSSYRIKEEEEK